MNKAKTLKETRAVNPDALLKQSQELLGGKQKKEVVNKTEPENGDKKVNSVIKINVLLPRADHGKYKAYCALENISIQDKALELVKVWLDTKPNIG